MSPSARRNLMIVILPLMVGVVILQSQIDPTARQIRGNQKTPFIGLTNEFILGPLLGMQQAIAGLLWVRADEFFHEGDYDAILPIVRMVTWLDPHQLDVYITGAWHLAYNFTDSNERSDRRYIPAAQKLLEEGDANNPKVFDIAFEAGWQNTDKIKNYVKAEEWFRKCTMRKAEDEQGRLTKEPPMFVWHQLAHALERQGRIDEAVGVWQYALAKTEEKLKTAKQNDWTTRNVRDSERHNLILTLKRKFSRTQHMIDFDVDRQRTKSVDMKTGEPSPRDAYIFISQDEVRARTALFKKANEPVPPMAVGQPRPPATKPAWDTAFDGRPTFPQEKVMELKGTFNVGDGARVTIRLHDDNWRERQLREFTFDVDQTQTIMIDQHSVRNGVWGRKIDMSKDPKMYSFSRPFYYLVFEFNPRSTSPFIQDRFGWNGEGMRDAKYLWKVIPEDPKQPPYYILRKVYRLSREQIFGSKPVTEADVISNAEYDRIQQEQRQQTASAQ